MPVWKPRFGPRFLSAVVACTLTVASARAGDDPPKPDPCAEALPSYVECAGTPALGDDEFGIRIAFSGGVTDATFSADDAAWVLHGAYLVDRQDLLENCGEPGDAVWIVVRDPDNGIHTCGIHKHALPARGRCPLSPDGGLVSLGSQFNIDLRSQCRLSGEPGRHRVVALLMGHISPLATFVVGPQAARPSPGHVITARNANLAGRIEHQIRVLEGELDPDALVRMFDARKVALVRCAQFAAKTEPDLHGRLSLRLSIKESGRAVDVNVNEGTMDNEVLSTCLHRKLRQFRYPRPGSSGAVVELTLTVRPSRPDPEECSPNFTIRAGESAACATQASVFDAYKTWARASAVRIDWKVSSFHSKRYPEHETLGYTMVRAAAHNDRAQHSWEDRRPSTWTLLDDGQLHLPVFEPFGVRWTDRVLTVRDVVICRPQAIPDATETLTDPQQGCRSLGQRIRERAPLAASDEEFQDEAFSYLSGLLALVLGPGEVTEVSAALLRSGIVVHPFSGPPLGHDGAVWYGSYPVYRPLLLRRENGQMFLGGFFRLGGDYYDVELTLDRQSFLLKVEHVGSHARHMILEI